MQLQQHCLYRESLSYNEILQGAAIAIQTSNACDVYWYDDVCNVMRACLT